MFRPKILHVDDDRDFLTLFSLTFGGSMDIISAETGTAACNLLAAEPFDAVITDYEMTDMNGIELLKHIKKTNKSLPVIFYTGQGNEAVAREAFISGAADYFVKNISEFAHKEKIINSINRTIEKRQAEEALKESEKKYKFIYDASMEIHVLVDLRFIIIDVNKQALEVMGCEKEQIIGRSIVEMVVEEDRERGFSLLSQNITGIKTSASIFRVMTPRGIRQILTREGAAIFTNSAGEPESLLISGIDVTELGTTQDALRKREELLRAITCGARIAISIIDQEGNITYWNDDASNKFKYSQEEVLGKPFHTVILPKRYHAPYRLEFEAFRKTDKKVLTGMTIALTAIDKEGDEFPMELSLCSVQFENTWHAVGIIRDMIRQRKTEEALKESREQFSSLVECAEDAIFTLSPEGRFMSANPAFEKMTGWLECSLLNELFMPYIHREDRKAAGEAFERALQGEQVPTQELRIKLREGGYTIGEIKLNPLIQSGQITGVVGVGLDITDRKRAEEELININRELSDFAHTISHDLKGQLTMIQGYLNLVKDNPQLFETYFDRISRKNRHLIDFINNLLKLSQAGKVIGEKKPVKLATLVRDAYENTRMDAISSILEINDSLPMMKGDPERIAQMFTNLFQNSFRYRDPAKETLVIKVNAIPEENDLHLQICDNGTGIKCDDINRIFGAGFTMGNNMGSGFGLAIVKKIVSAHGGEVWAESEGENRGAVFHIKLPCLFVEDQT